MVMGQKRKRGPQSLELASQPIITVPPISYCTHGHLSHIDMSLDRTLKIGENADLRAMYKFTFA